MYENNTPYPQTTQKHEEKATVQIVFFGYIVLSPQ